MDKYLSLIPSVLAVALAAWIALRGSTRDDAARSEKLASLATQLATALPQLDAARLAIAQAPTRSEFDAIKTDVTRQGARLEELDGCCQDALERAHHLEPRVAVLESQIKAIEARVSSVAAMRAQRG